MKKLMIILTVTIVAGLCSCRKDLLNVQPTNLLTANQVFSTPAAITAYFASLYASLPVEDFNFAPANGSANSFETFPAHGSGYLANWTEESSNSMGGTSPNLGANTYDNIYAGIRNVNSFLQQIVTVQGLDSTTKLQYIAEAKFIRAYDYFALVKFYGGVPLLTVPQTKPTPLPRNTEVQVWNQIKSDLDSAIEFLPPTSDYGRANKYVAYTLEARAMLYAASIGYFGDPSVLQSTNGTNGVDMSSAKSYMQAAYNAADSVITSGMYSLFMQYPQDLVKNFEYLFYQCGPGQTNPEAIFCRGFNYNATNSTHSQDLMVLPYAIESPAGYGNRLQPSLNMVEEFENVDGSPHLLGGTGIPLTYYHFPTLASAFAKKDPRFAATVVATGTYFRLDTITSQIGVIYNGKEYLGSNYNQYFNPSTQSFSQAYTPGDVAGTGNSNYTDFPFWLKKWTDPVNPRANIAAWTSLTSYMDMRYGEVLLDYAESSFELGHPATEAQWALNQLRQRAGIPLLNAGDITRDTIRHEWRVEFAFENKTYWNYDRWRTLTTVFNQYQLYGCRVFYDLDTHDYVFQKYNDGGPRTYLPKQYYFDFPSQDFASDPLLTHNPGY